ncbi:MULTISPECIES: hypothetical protein [Olivibacter]|jgi:hypothetical protein|uniref:Uncharacterized protein n=3 Tax=Sphingobacteriaceae TaxID=84566 RepID=F4C496_SPHS2|nr:MULTISPECIES: hypothetical protein [Olivibacter]MCL4638946.1 hypothetical protein [Olivibacter sp. UJ_SKK_5.1]MDM8175462.1 hypothetical protein [Olivibacter sp. 47]MDX3914073.1 hypothetical protein [Pseudosphingobacterium sp.]QEL02218.1 hypothetical protein FKG96_15840 [Olivibacter sp. LS-1]
MTEDKANSSKTKMETDYGKHEENPGPPKAALEEKDDKKVGFTIHWAIIVAIVALAIAYFFFM